jgi:hypothetical protein
MIPKHALASLFCITLISLQNLLVTAFSVCLHPDQPRKLDHRQKNVRLDESKSTFAPVHSSITESEVLARNQGELFMATVEERVSAALKQKQLLEENNISVPKANENDHTKYDLDADTDGFGAVIMEDGVVRIDNVLSQKTAKDMLKYVDQLLLDTLTAVDEGIFPQEALFGNVFSKENRWDLLLPIEASKNVVKCLTELLYEGSPISTAIESIMGKEAELYELSTLISDPGSQAQPLHPDIKYQDTIHPLLTCFVALQDIDPSMGPTLFMKKSASKEYHHDLHNRHLDKGANGLVATSYNELGTLGAGDCSLYSGMTLHCGSANKSNKRRRLFYFSFINKSLFHQKGGRNFVSIRSEVDERNLTLGEIQEMINAWE